MGKHTCKTIVFLVTSHQNIQHPPIDHPWISFAILINWCFESNMYPPFSGPPWRWQTSGLWISLQYTSFSRQVSLLAELKRRSLDHTFLHSYLTCAQNGNCLLLGVVPNSWTQNIPVTTPRFVICKTRSLNRMLVLHLAPAPAWSSPNCSRILVLHTGAPPLVLHTIPSTGR